MPLFGWMIERSELDSKSFLSDATMLARRQIMRSARFCHPAPATRDLQAQGLLTQSLHIPLQVKAGKQGCCPSRSLESLFANLQASIHSCLRRTVERSRLQLLHCFLICMMLDSLQLPSRWMWYPLPSRPTTSALLVPTQD